MELGCIFHTWFMYLLAIFFFSCSITNAIAWYTLGCQNWLRSDGKKKRSIRTHLGLEIKNKVYISFIKGSQPKSKDRLYEPFTP